ncbi:MAG: HNH endonuclease signature motif containing protein [Candidatus Nanopelagicales bacterium]
MTERTCKIDGCDRTNIMARGWCGPHYKRWYRHGDPQAPIHRRAPDGATLEDRLRYVGWQEVQKRPDLTPCWEWQGLKDRAGYGRVWDGKRVAAAHRAAFETWNDPIQTGLLVCHRCDNPPCMNPEHLFLGTDQQNLDDAVAKKRIANGERRPHTLTDSDVAEIRAAYTGERGQQAILAREYGTVPSNISVIVRRLSRKEETHWETMPDDKRLA